VDRPRPRRRHSPTRDSCAATMPRLPGMVAGSSVTEPWLRCDTTPGRRERGRPMPVRGWALWQRPRRVVLFLLGMEALALGCFVLVFLTSGAPTTAQWLQLLVLAACGTFHVQSTRSDQQRRHCTGGLVLSDLVR